MRCRGPGGELCKNRSEKRSLVPGHKLPEALRMLRIQLMAMVLLGIVFAQAGRAQPPGGGDRGSRGGFPGGGFPGGGMPGGGMPGGGFPGGGFPGGGFPGGGMPGGGFPGGGDRGSRGGSGGGGGFNPADMLSRFDRNNNKMIDPEEAEGPARFFLERLAASNPKIDLKRPVPLDLLTSEMEKMRGGGSAPENAQSSKPELLVPDFSLDTEPGVVEGFGTTSSMFNVKVEERDLKEAEERIRRYDRNNDGILSKEEIAGNRWSDDPMQFDRNGDGKISKSEMAVRYAKRRADEQATQSNPQNNNNRSRGGFAWGGGQVTPGQGGWSRPEAANAKKEKPEEKSRFGDAKSYRMKSVKEKTDGTKGLPDWFARSDADGNGQVLLSEYSSSLTAESMAEFQKFDLNDDFIITASECLAAVKNGASASSSSSTASSSRSTSSSAAVVPSSGGGTADNTQLEWAKKQIAKYDKNKDEKLSVDEWSAMIVKPDGADANGDGTITADEYAAYRTQKK